MVFLKRFYLKFLVLLLVHSGVATDFANNACYDVNSYYFSAFNSDCYYNPDISPDNNLVWVLEVNHVELMVHILDNYIESTWI